MPLPEPVLDDLRFQRDLVDEARRRIIRYCPEWTEYNLSDPGITLIELFAWMTEMIVYRLNRVPEKNYIKFMELLGIQLQPAHSARTEVTFRLAIPFPVTPEDDTTAYVPQGTEVATRPSDEEPEIIFTTDERLVIVAPKLTQLRREEDFQQELPGTAGRGGVLHVLTAPSPSWATRSTWASMKPTPCAATSCGSISSARKRKPPASAGMTRRSCGRSRPATAAGRKCSPAPCPASATPPAA